MHSYNQTIKLEGINIDDVYDVCLARKYILE